MPKLLTYAETNVTEMSMEIADVSLCFRLLVNFSNPPVTCSEAYYHCSTP